MQDTFTTVSGSAQWTETCWHLAKSQKQHKEQHGCQQYNFITRGSASAEKWHVSGSQSGSGTQTRSMSASDPALDSDTSPRLGSHLGSDLDLGVRDSNMSLFLASSRWVTRYSVWPVWLLCWNGWTNQDAVWRADLDEPNGRIPDLPRERGNFGGHLPAHWEVHWISGMSQIYLLGGNSNAAFAVSTIATCSTCWSVTDHTFTRTRHPVITTPHYNINDLQFFTKETTTLQAVQIQHI